MLLAAHWAVVSAETSLMGISKKRWVTERLRWEEQDCLKAKLPLIGYNGNFVNEV